MDDLDIYDDLEEFQEVQEKKSKELLAWETKYNESLETIETQNAQLKELRKKIKTMEVNFQNLLDTARAEVNRKDKQLTQLRKEKDDICFRRKPPRNYRAAEDSQLIQMQQENGADMEPAAGVVSALAAPTQSTAEVVALKSSNPFTERARSRDSRDDRTHAPQQRERYTAHADASSRTQRRGHYSERDCSSSERGGKRERDHGEREERDRTESRRTDYRRTAERRRDDVMDSAPSGSSSSSRYKNHESLKDHTISLDRNKGIQREYATNERTSDKIDQIAAKERSSNLRDVQHDGLIREKDKIIEGKSSLKEPHDEPHKKYKTAKDIISPNENISNTKEKRSDDGKVQFTSAKRDKEPIEKRVENFLPKAQAVVSNKDTYDSKKTEKESVKNKDDENGKHTSPKRDKLLIENKVNKNLPKKQEIAPNKDMQNRATSIKELVEKVDIKNDGAKTTQDTVQKINAKSKPLVEINTMESSRATSSASKMLNEISKPSRSVESIASLQPLAKSEMTVPMIDTKTPIDSAHQITEQNRNVNSNFDHTLRLTTPKRVAIFNTLFGATPPSSAESGKSAANSKLLPNVMQLLNTNGSATTSPSLYTDDSDVEAQNKLKPGVNREVKAKEQSISSQEVEGYFTANEISDECEATTVDLVIESVAEENLKTQGKTTYKPSKIAPCLAVIFGTSEAQAIPALSLIRDVVEEEVTNIEGVIETFTDQTEVIEILDDIDVDNISEEPVPPANEKAGDMVALPQETVETTQVKNNTKNTQIETKKEAIVVSSPVPMSPANEKAADLVDLSEEIVETIQAIEKEEVAVPLPVPVPPANEEVVGLVDLSEQTVETIQTKTKTKKTPVEITEKEEVAVPLTLAVTTSNGKDLDLVDLSEKTVETTQARNTTKPAQIETEKEEIAVALPVQVTVPPANQIAADLIKLSVETFETTQTKNKKTQIENNKKEEVEVPLFALVPPANEKATDLVNSVYETVETTQVRNKNKKAHIEIIENIRLPSLFEMQKKTDNVCPTTEHRNFGLSVVKDNNTNLNADTKVMKETTRRKVKAVKYYPKGKKFAREASTNNVDLKVIDTIDISDDDSPLDDMDTDIDIGVSEDIVPTENEKIYENPTITRNINPLATVKSSEHVETIIIGNSPIKQLEDHLTIKTVGEMAQTVNEVEELETLKSFTADLVSAVVVMENENKAISAEFEQANTNETNEEKDFASIKTNENQKTDEILNTLKQSNLLDVTENIVKNLNRDNTDEMSVKETQNSLELDQKVTIIEKKQLIEKDDVINEVTTTTEVEKVMLVTNDIIFEEDDDLETLAGKDFAEIEQEMAEMHHTPKDTMKKESIFKKISEVKTPEKINSSQSESIIPAETTTTYHAKEEHKKKLYAVTIVIEDDSEDVVELVNIAETANQRAIANLRSQDEVSDKANRFINITFEKTESSSITEAQTSPQPETDEEISAALAQLRELQNNSETRRKCAKIRKSDGEIEVSVTEDAVAFVLNNCHSAIEPLPTPKKVKSPTKIEISANSSTEKKCDLTEQPNVIVEKLLAEDNERESIVKPIKVASKKLVKCKDAEKKAYQNEIKIILPKTKKGLHKMQDERSVKLKSKAHARKQVTKVATENKPDVIKVKNFLTKFKIPKKNTKPQICKVSKQDAVNITKPFLTQFKIPKKNTKPQISDVSNEDALNITKDLAVSKALATFEKAKSAESVVEVVNTQLTCSKVTTNTERTARTTEDSKKMVEGFVNSKTTATQEGENKLEIPHLEEEINSTQLQLVKNYTITTTKEPITTPKKAHINTENNIASECTIEATFSPTNSQCSDDFSALEDQIHKPQNHTLKRRILDTSSDEELKSETTTITNKMHVHKLISPRIATPKRELKRKRMSPCVKLTEEIVENFETNIAIEQVTKKQKVTYTTITSPFTQRLDAVAIFHTEVPAGAAQLPAMSPANTSQDAKYKEIDLHLQSMFQSPAHTSDYQPEPATADETFNSTVASNDGTQTNLSVEETTAHYSSLGQSSTALLDTSVGAGVKRLSLGKKDYVIENVSENLVNIFITRRRGKKRKTALVTTLPNKTPNV